MAGQLSFFQFYNPEHVRGFGIGVANGALWTITVELQFYLIIPCKSVSPRWIWSRLTGCASSQT